MSDDDLPSHDTSLLLSSFQPAAYSRAIRRRNPPVSISSLIPVASPVRYSSCCDTPQLGPDSAIQSSQSSESGAHD